MTANSEAQVAKRPRKTATRKVTAKAKTEAPTTTTKKPTAKPAAKKPAAVYAVTVRKVTLGVKDLPKALYDDALERVGGDPKKLYRVKVLSPSSYELLMPNQPQQAPPD